MTTDNGLDEHENEYRYDSVACTLKCVKQVHGGYVLLGAVYS